MSYRERMMEVKRKNHIRYQSHKTSLKVMKTFIDVHPAFMIASGALKFMKMETKNKVK
jgi:hypothetical protein